MSTAPGLRESTSGTLTSGLNVLGGLAARALADTMNLLRREFPHTVRVETTNHCQASCSFCPRASIGRDKSFMAPELFEKIVGDCVVGRCRLMHLHNFGEPLLDKHLPERIAYAHQSGIPRIKIFTNGALLKGKLAEDLLASGLDEIKVSIDGASAREFNLLRTGLDHAEVLENVRAFRKLRDAAGQRKPTIVAATCQTSNRAATEDLLRDVVDRIDFTQVHNWAGSLGLRGDRRIRKPCDRLWRTFTILVNGDVALCCLDHSGREILGNVHHQTIREIWNNARYRALRQLHRESRQSEISVCQNCSKCYF